MPNNNYSNKPRQHQQRPGTPARPRVLILTPTRELADQITKAANTYGKFLRFNIISLVGGMPYKQQLRDLSRPVDIIVATPGRLLDHMDNKRLDLSGIEMLILDEADRMLDISFFEVVKEISKATPATRQTLLFSATVESKLAPVISTLLKNPVEINLSEEVRAPAKIKQEAYLVDNSQHKMRLLQHFIENENIYKSIIFSATKVHADQLAKQLRDKGYEAAALHGDLKQQVRNRTVERLRQGKLQFIVATDVAARGIDINDVTHVINYDLPKFSEDYVHRIGRTGRAGKEGVAISFVLPLDARHLQKIERYIGEKLPLSVIPGLEPTKRLAKSNTNTAPKKKRFGGSGSAPRRDAGRGGFRENFSRDSFSKDRDFSRKPAAKTRPSNGDKFERSSKPRDDRFSKPREERASRPRNESFSSGREDYARKPRESFGKPPRKEFSSKPREAGANKPRDERFSSPRNESRGSNQPRISYARDTAAQQPRGRFSNEGRKSRPANGGGYARKEESPGRRNRGNKNFPRAATDRF